MLTSTMNSLLIFAACLALGSSSFIPSRRLQAQGVVKSNPKRCCLPDQWQSYIGESIFIPVAMTSLELVIDYAVNFDERQTAFRMLDKFSHQELSRGVLDFNAGIFYNISNGVCIKSTPPATLEEPIRCMPENSEYVGDYFVGGVKDGWKASIWRATNATKLIKNIEIAFSRECYPITENLVMNVGVDMNVVANFGNFEGRIRTPEMFDVPESCKNSSPKQAMVQRSSRV